MEIKMELPLSVETWPSQNGDLVLNMSFWERTIIGSNGRIGKLTHKFKQVLQRILTYKLPVMSETVLPIVLVLWTKWSLSYLKTAGWW